MNTFSDLPISPELLKSLNALEFLKPTTVQTQVIPPLLEGRNLITKAMTGSGKTAAFGIPIIENIEWVENHPQGLIIAPNRELVLQIAQDLHLIGRYKRVKTLPIYGRDSIKAQTLALKQKNHIVVATPGRLMDLIERGAMKLDKLKYLILDEADELLRPEFMQQLVTTFDSLPKHCSISLFSATVSDNINSIRSLEGHTFHYIDSTEGDRPDITETFYDLPEDEKFHLLNRLLHTFPNKGGIIFVSTKAKAEKLHNKLYKKSYSSTVIHSELQQRVRIKNMNEFKKGTYTYLVATDLSARGIDVDGIDLVINYDLPVDVSNYTHRIGRIGRNGNKGTAINFVCSEQKSLVKKIQIKIQRDITWGDANFDLISNVSDSHIKHENQNRKIKGEHSTPDICKLYINGGKRKKLRAGDIVGAICSIESLTPDDIGIIEIKENETYVEILNYKARLVIDQLRDRNIKGRKYKIHKAK